MQMSGVKLFLGLDGVNLLGFHGISLVSGGVYEENFFDIRHTAGMPVYLLL